MTQAETMAMIRDKIRAELPTLLKLYRADKFLVNRIVASATTFFEEVRNDPKHPFRGEFNRMLLSFVDRLSSDSTFASRIDGLTPTAITTSAAGRMRPSASSTARTRRPPRMARVEERSRTRMPLASIARFRRRAASASSWCSISRSIRCTSVTLAPVRARP